MLNKPAGVWYEEFSNLAAPLELDAAAPLTLTPAAHATRWADGLLADGADVLARYRHRNSVGSPRSPREHGDGRITVLGTVPNPALGAELMRWAVPEPIAAGWSIVGSPVRVSSGRVTDGGRVWFVHNWSGSDATVTVPAALTDLDSGAALDAGSTISLAPWSYLTAMRGDHPVIVAATNKEKRSMRRNALRVAAALGCGIFAISGFASSASGLAKPGRFRRTRSTRRSRRRPS